MSLELLAHELLLDIFEYISTIDILYAFYDLNNRFNNLIFLYFKTHSIDFRSISKTNFDLICQKYLSKFPDRIISLHLSDDDETSQQIYLFFSYFNNFNYFIHLQSLSLYRIYSVKIMQKLMIEWHHLPNLTCLNIIDCYIQDVQWNRINITNSIWSLSKLIHCHLHTCNEIENSFIVPNIISTSIRHLNIETLTCHFTQLCRLFQYTPHLQSLSLGTMKVDFINEQLPSVISSITKLKVNISYSMNIIGNLLKIMPNLTHLTAKIWRVNIDGYQWEQIINTYLPKLQIFHFKMIIKLDGNNKIKNNRINQLLDSFRTQFWLAEHQWYIRCDWDRETESKYIYLYTLPYIYSSFPTYAVNFQSKSTFPYKNKNNQKFYNRVHHLNYQFGTFEGLASSDIRFVNIRSLSIRLPVSNHFLTVIPTLNRLTSLTVWLDDQYEIQSLLDRAPNLYSLTFVSWSTNRVPLLDITNKSIRRINLQCNTRYFNERECIEICHSSLGKQCEVLGIHVEKRENIIYLINTMTNLRALKIRCLEDKYLRNYELPTKDKFIVWLKEQLPSTCMITRRDDNIYYIHGWIR